MNTTDKLSVIAKSKKKGKLFGGKRNAVPKSSGGRKNVGKKGGGAKAALLRRIHKDPDIQKLLKNNPKYDIIVVRKVTASFADVMVKANDEAGGDYTKEQWFKVGQEVNPNYTQEQFEKDWSKFEELKQEHTTASDEEDFKAKEQAKKDLAQARKDLLIAKKSKNEKEVARIRARIEKLEDASKSEHDKKSLKMHDDWAKEQERRRKVGGYD